MLAAGATLNGEGSATGHVQPEREPVSESITITDNRTGESVEVPITNGGVDAAEWRKLLPGIWFLDPAFGTTASTESAISYLDGGNGILQYRGYPIEQLAKDSTHLEVAYLLLNGELPKEEQHEDTKAWAGVGGASASGNLEEKGRWWEWK